MGVGSITTSLISALGNNSGSIVPVIAKDTGSNLGVTLIHTTNGSKRDGKEKAIEEFGTAAIWLGGIPFLKKVFDLTAYKIAKINPDFDVRKLNLKNPDNIDVMMKKVGKGTAEFLQLERIKNNQTLTKGLFISKFVIATAATLGALGALINYKQKTTEKDIKERIVKEINTENDIFKNRIGTKISESRAFGYFGKSFTTSKIPGGNTGKNVVQPAFKGFGISEFMFNPLYNMSILDAGITTKRLSQGRHGEKGEIAIKEGMTIAMFYVFADKIQKVLEKIVGKLSKHPVDLDYRVLSDKKINTAIQNGSLINSIGKFKELSNNQVVDHIFNAKDDVLVNLLKKTGEIAADKKTGKINAMKLIEPDKLKETVEKLENFVKTQATSGEKIENFISKSRKLKAGTIFANIGIAILILGILQPLIVISKRKMKNHGNSDNPAIENVEADLKKQYMALK